MGLLTKTIFEALADGIARRAIAGAQTPAAGTLLGNTAQGLAQYLDGATGDPDLQTALLSSLADVDRQVLTENYRTYLESALNQSRWKAPFLTMNSYIKSAAGGSFADLATYVAAESITLHPIAAELARLALGESCLAAAGVGVGAMHPLMQTGTFDRVYVGAQGSLVNETTDAASVTADDVTMFATNGHVLVLQSRGKFNRFLSHLSTLGSGNAAVTVKYWNGTAWASVAGLVDLTVGFSVDGGMTSWTMPTDWVPCNMDAQGTPAVFDSTQEGELYTIMVTRTAATLVTPPKLGWVLPVPAAVTASNGGLYGVDQPPIAVVNITGTNLATVTLIQNPDFARFAAPGTTGSALQLRAISGIGANATFTLGYTDQDGNAATKAQTSWSSPVAGDVKVLALDSGDTAIRTFVPTTCAITTAATAGVFVVEVVAYPRSIAAK